MKSTVQIRFGAPTNWKARAIFVATLLMGVCATHCLAARAHADLLGYEQFSYTTGVNVVNQNGGDGFLGQWKYVAGTNGNSLTTASSLTAPGFLPTAGGGVRTSEPSRVGRYLDTSTNGPFASYLNAAGNIGADNTTLYFSFLQRAEVTGPFYALEMHRDDLNDGNASVGAGQTLFIGNDNPGAFYGLRLNRDSSKQSSLGSENTSSNLYVVQINFKPGNDDVFVYRNPASTTHPGTGAATATLLGQADLSFDGLSLSAFVGGAGPVNHDELRFGTSFADVFAAPASAPANKIALMNPTTNDGSFESNPGNTINTNAPFALGSVWTLSPTTAGGVLSNPPHSTDFMTDGSDAIFADAGSTTARSYNILGTNGYTTVREGDLFEWSMDFNSFAADSGATVQLDFGNGPITVGMGLTGNSDIRDPHRISGTYIATAADAAGGMLSIWASISRGSNNVYADNVLLSVTPAAVPEPESMAIWTLIGLCGLGLGIWRRRR